MVRREERGFTIIELVVVIIIIGVLAALVAPKFFGRVGEAKQKSAKAQIELFGTALDALRLDVGRYPTTQEGLNSLVINPGVENWDGPYVKTGTITDPWKRPYQYQQPGTHGEFDLFSYGRDGNPGGEGEDKDITSWE